MELLDQVRRTIRRHGLATSATRVVIGLSGGSDSVALACLLRALDESGDLRVAGVAHFNHQIRPGAPADEKFCAELAASMGWPFLSDAEDVAARARRDRCSIESAGRTARHEFFGRARMHFRADVVAIGHTRDDQAETFLLRLLRGASARGLAAMHPRQGHIIRPLLDCRRATLRGYLESQHIEYRHDESNEDRSIPRNRIRAELLPVIERRFNPAIVDVLADEAELARAEWDWMEAEADTQGLGIWQRDGKSWTLVADKLNTLPVALARLIVRRAMSDMSSDRPAAFAHVEEVLRLSRCGGGPVDLPGGRAQLIGAEVVLTSRPAGGDGRRSRPPTANLFSYPLSIPGEVIVTETGLAVSAQLGEQARGEVRVPGSGTSATVRLDRCGDQLAVRNRRPGDRFRPLGLDGRKKLQDFFVDRKIPRERRDEVPLVVDALDRIVWVGGHSIDEEFRVTDPAQAVLILRLKPLGGPA
jgi:tRNA(Ile)-lysidine synthase